MSSSTSQQSNENSSRHSRNLIDASSSSNCESLYFVAQSLLAQVVTLLEEVVTTDEQLTRISEYVPGSTIGKHLRHLHDHYRLLLDALQSQPSSSSESTTDLCYDVRSRNGASETSHKEALNSFISLQDRLEKETGKGLGIEPERRILLEAVTPFVVKVDSSFARELWFVSLHATHHLALVRVVATELGLRVRDEFGVAPSTLVSRTQKQDDSNGLSKSDKREKAKSKVENKVKRDEAKEAEGEPKRRESKL